MKPAGGRLIEESGPWAFITRRVFEGDDGAGLVLHSRRHRKAFDRSIAAAEARLLRCLWMPDHLNWWIGVVFAVGSFLFALGGVLALWPELARRWSITEDGINAIFFSGSIPFTTAAYLQLFQSANAPDFSSQLLATERRSTRWLGWRPHDIGWLSSALQFVGTLLFNVNTLDGMLTGLDWLQQDLEIWLPDFLGSVLFLASGYLAFAEICHARWAWKPRSLSWWVTFLNLLGCVAFMVSACFAFVPPHSSGTWAMTVATVFTFLGALGFLAGSLLMLPEMVVPSNPVPSSRAV